VVVLKSRAGAHPPPHRRHEARQVSLFPLRFYHYLIFTLSVNFFFEAESVSLKIGTGF